MILSPRSNQKEFLPFRPSDACQKAKRTKSNKKPRLSHDILSKKKRLSHDIMFPISEKKEKRTSPSLLDASHKEWNTNK